MSIARRRFRIIKEIAEGGFGKVYLAEQISSDGFSRIVAIKLLHAKWSSHDEVVKRTRDEARVLGRIRHQHIVKVEDLTSIEGKCAIVMEYLEGVDLKWMSSFLKERDQEFSRAALFEIALAVASALDAAYNSVPLQGDQPLKAIHRDIKPSNVFVTVAGGVKVLDFGTARANFAEREAKTQALAFGSQGYMAPERMLGEEDTPAADVFSLGITLYELLTLESFGRIPPRPNKFQKKMDEKVASVVLNGDAEWVNQVRDTLRLMLSYAPADRPTAAQLVEIMDYLAQEAGDTGLRRYCRTVVAEAKDALPVLDTGDPLTGTIVDEDEFTGPASFAPGLLPDALGTPDGMGGAQTTMPPGGPPSRPPTARGSVSASLPPPNQSPSSPNAPAVTGTLPPPPPSDVRTLNPNVGRDLSAFSPRPVPGGGRSLTPDPGTPLSRLKAASSDVPTPAPLPEREARGSGRGRALGVLIFGVLLVVAGVGMVFGVSTVGLALLYGGGNNPEAPRPGPIPPPGEPDPPPTAGSTVIAPDSRADKKAVPTVLTYRDGAGAEIEIRGPGGFHATWDGKAPFDLGPAGDGPYTASITTAAGQKFRLRKFTVDGAKATCAFAFDPGAGEWTGGCN